MPSSPHDSSDSQKPSATPSADRTSAAKLGRPELLGSPATPSDGEGMEATERPLLWRRNFVLFLATVASVFVTGYFQSGASRNEALVDSAQFTATLLTILLAHEFGHYIAARLHKVDASLPFFIPMPMLSPFGTMGAVIRMRSAIPTRRALLDIGASGPLAGLAFAIPLYIYGVAHSKIVASDGTGGTELGNSLLLRAIEHVAAPNVPEGMTILLSPIAFAAWGGMFVTMINLLPVGQLDAGHVAYALFGPRQNRIAQLVHRAVLVFFFVSLGSFIARDLRAGLGFTHIGTNVGNSVFWLVWFEVLAVLGALSQPAPDDDAPVSERVLTIRTRAVATLGLAVVAWVLQTWGTPLLWLAWFASLGVLLAMERRWGALRANTLFDHPPTGAERLGVGRSIVAVITLLFFALLFMPTPFSM